MVNFASKLVGVYVAEEKAGRLTRDEAPGQYRAVNDTGPGTADPGAWQSGAAGARQIVA